MSWTEVADLKAQVQRHWDRGRLLACLAGGESPFPLKLSLKAPTAQELASRFDEARKWISRLDAASGSCRIEWREIRHRTLGKNRVPAAVWLDTLDQALTLIDKTGEAKRFVELLELTEKHEAVLLSWTAKHPLKALEHADAWPELLRALRWLREHPRPGIYLRQMDVPGVHTKFVERHRGILTELLDLALPAEAVDAASAQGQSGMAAFCRRFGFLDKPERVRFRVLDPTIRILPPPCEQDMELTAPAFAALNPKVERVFITENEVNFLAFPEHPGALAIFGKGYGFASLAQADWLSRREVLYWGDLDTHGFAILDQLRRHLPHAASLLMDANTLLAHRELWGREERPEHRDLLRLTPAEAAVYEGLRDNRWGERVRLEQERIGFNRLQETLRQLVTDARP